jgi:hypothetical protein
MSQAKYKTYVLYKALSNELFKPLPRVDVSNVARLPAKDRGELRQKLCVGYERNRRCAELRELYRDTFVPPGRRDFQHEKAIEEARRRAQFYSDLLAAMAANLQEGAAGPGSGTPPSGRGSGDTADSGRAIRTGKPAKGPARRRNKASPGFTGPDPETAKPEAENAFWEAVRQEAYGSEVKMADQLYKDLVSDIVARGTERLGREPGVRLVNSLLYCVISLFGQPSGKLNLAESDWSNWLNECLGRMKRVNRKMFR